MEPPGNVAEPPGNIEYSTAATPRHQTQTKLLDDVLGDVKWQVHEVSALTNTHNQVDRVDIDNANQHKREDT